MAWNFQKYQGNESQGMAETQLQTEGDSGDVTGNWTCGSQLDPSAVKTFQEQLANLNGAWDDIAGGYRDSFPDFEGCALIM